jgi:hypothetical protein
MLRIIDIHAIAVAVIVGTAATGAAAQPEPTPRPTDRVDPAIREALPPTDVEISDQVESRLNRELEIFGTRAIVRDGVVTVHGTVRSESERLRALDIAREVPGVRRVDGSLAVDATAADDAPPELDHGASLDAVVAAELRGDPVLGSRDIRVTADRRTNTVTLIGVVKSQSERERALRIASDALAAGQVRNQLEVRAD